MLVLQGKCYAKCFTCSACYLGRPLLFLEYLIGQAKMTINILPHVFLKCS